MVDGFYNFGWDFRSINYLNSQESQKSKFKKNPKFHFVILKIKK